MLSVNASAALSKDWAANKCLLWGFFFVGGKGGVPLSTAAKDGILEAGWGEQN